jgi:hypothetical protein
MTMLKLLTGAALMCGILSSPIVAGAADTSSAGDAKSPKPYPLKTCIVSGEKLGGDMGKPYVFVYEGQEIKLCCKRCLKDFNKAPGKYLQKMADAQHGTAAAAPGALAHAQNTQTH